MPAPAVGRLDDLSNDGPNLTDHESFDMDCGTDEEGGESNDEDAEENCHAPSGGKRAPTHEQQTRLDEQLDLQESETNLQVKSILEQVDKVLQNSIQCSNPDGTIKEQCNNKVLLLSMRRWKVKPQRNISREGKLA